MTAANRHAAGNTGQLAVASRTHQRSTYSTRLDTTAAGTASSRPPTPCIKVRGKVDRGQRGAKSPDATVPKTEVGFSWRQMRRFRRYDWFGSFNKIVAGANKCSPLKLRLDVSSSLPGRGGRPATCAYSHCYACSKIVSISGKRGFQRSSLLAGAESATKTGGSPGRLGPESSLICLPIKRSAASLISVIE